MLRLKTARNVYNELLQNISKYESIEDFLSECGYLYDSVLYYICDCLQIKCDDGVYRYLDNAITKEWDFDDVYEYIHYSGQYIPQNITITINNPDKLEDAFKFTGIDKMKFNVNC